MTSPLAPEQSALVDPQVAQPAPVSIGTSLAITGICTASFLLLGFLLVLNYTDLLVGNSAARTATANNPDAFVGELFILAITFSPMIFSYKLCAKLIDKA